MSVFILVYKGVCGERVGGVRIQCVHIQQELGWRSIPLAAILCISIRMFPEEVEKVGCVKLTL